MAMAMATFTRAVFRLFHVPAVLGICLCASLISTGCGPTGAKREASESKQEQRQQLQRPGVTAFDARQASKLSAERRAALEQELFSELQVWNRGSRKYPDQAGIAAREQRWQAMADEGLELAHITLTVLEPRTGKAHELTPAIKRLEQLAEQGDAGAMCLIERLTNVTAAQLDWKQYEATAKKWLERGAELGHPECLITMGGKLLGGIGYEKDIKGGLEMSFAGHEKGYSHGGASLVLFFIKQGLADKEHLKRAFCWSAIDNELNSRDYAGYLERTLRKQSETGWRNQQGLLRELEQWKPTLQECLELGMGG